jgi:coenzyme PQQ biosynthesis protein PqqD
VIAPDAVPRLRHARLRRRGDETWLLGPERGLLLGGSAPAVLALVDGRRTVATIIGELVRAHGAPPVTVEREVAAFLEALAGRHLLELA